MKISGCIGAVALVAGLSLSSAVVQAKDRLKNDITHATDMVDELDRIRRIRDEVCPRVQHFSGCMVEYGFAITFRIHEYSANLKRYGLWEPWQCGAECKKAEQHLQFLSKKYGQ